jgi:putative PIN family toxin of toxin-antitoxin system
VRVVLDTNVIISALLFGGTPRELLTSLIRAEFEIVTSPFLLDELERLLQRKFSFSRQAARELRREVWSLADEVEPPHVPRVCSDPDDDHVVAAAVEGEAGYIVTGDEALLEIDSHLGIEILRPAEFASRLRLQ